MTPKAGEHAPELSRIAQDLQIRKIQVENVVALLDEGNTVPFITRYRKERTGGLNEEVIRQIQARVQYLRQLADRKQTILKSLETQGKLADDLLAAILAADTSKRLEDLYLPYRPKKRTLATAAREKGLEPLADAIWSRDPAVANLSDVLPGMVNPEKGLNTVEEALQGVQHILAERVSETAEVRAAVRTVLWKTGKLVTARAESVPEGKGLEYKDYFQFSEGVRHIPAHRILAINRGEREGVLKPRLEWDAEAAPQAALAKLPLADHPHAEFLRQVAQDALARLLIPSLDREIRRELTEEAEEHGVQVFARNLRNLLLQPPLRDRRVLAIDPGFRSGCKLAALDEFGNLLEHTVIFPFGKTERGRDKRGVKSSAAMPAAPAPVAPAEGAAASAQGPGAVPAEQAATAPADSTAAAPAEGPAALSANPPPTAPAVSPTATETAQPPGSLPADASSAEMPLPAAAETISSAPPGSPTTEPVPEAPVAPNAPAPVSQRMEAKAKIHEFVEKHRLNVVAMGNGTACRETEELVSELIAERLPELVYVTVNEAGASVYSASAIGREEFPNYDALTRGTVSIGRRLQDPLSELVKIDPQSIGVGLYQHDIQPRRLKDSLQVVIESCVNHVGVDLNTGSVPLLRHLSGLNQLAARQLVDYRNQHGPFRSREQLLQVPGMGPARYMQAAGFLKLRGGDNPLDQTWVHPESYPVANQLLTEIGTSPQALNDRQETAQLRERLKNLPLEELAGRLNTGVPTLRDIIEALSRPDRDPREDLPPPIFRKGILQLEDLQPGMDLKGTVLNVVDFGAFIDVGLKDSGLVHISQMATRYIKNPHDLVAVGDVVTVWVLTVDRERRRVSLTMIRPGSERKPEGEGKPAAESKPAEKPAAQPHGPQGGRPPRGRRPPPRRLDIALPGQRQPATTTAASTNQATADPASRPAAAAPRPAPRPRKPQRQPARPKLSQAALEGEAPLRTFSELKAYFDAQRHEAAPQRHEPAPPRQEAPAQRQEAASPQPTDQTENAAPQ
jgi:uncharacterized protein